MRTSIKVIRECYYFMRHDLPDEVLEKRRDAIKALNAELGVSKVIDAHYAGHDQRYFDLINNWKDGHE